MPPRSPADSRPLPTPERGPLWVAQAEPWARRSSQRILGPPRPPSPEPRLHSAQAAGRPSVLACAGRGAEEDIRLVGEWPGRGCARAPRLPRPAFACAAEARRGAVRFRRRGPAWRGSGPGRAGPGPKCLYFSPRCWSCCWLRLAHSS